jgi:ADP-ribose pyrophosphatase YjhB (NUDIX family)
MELKKPIIVVSAFIEKDGKYLLINCAKFNDWRVPGGRIEPKERAEDALKREIKEELGIEISNTKFLGYGQDFREVKEWNAFLSRVVLYFKCRTNEEIKPDKNEIIKFKWLSIDEIKNHPEIEGAMKDFFTRVNQDEL